MRLQELFEQEHEKELYELCLKYYKLVNEYFKDRQEPPPKEMSQKLALHIDEYSELLIFLSDGGFDTIQKNKISDELANGAYYERDPLTNIDP